MHTASRLALAALLLVAPALRADSLFNFENIPQQTNVPFSTTDNGLTATFAGSGTVCGLGNFFTNLSGNALIQNFCADNPPGPLVATFSQPLKALSLDFALSNPGDSLDAALFDGSTLVALDQFASDPDMGEGLASFKGIFDSVVLTSPDGDNIAIDNLDATILTPEPNSLFLLATGTLALLATLHRQKAWSRLT